jgi:hypothetical protein
MKWPFGEDLECQFSAQESRKGGRSRPQNFLGLCTASNFNEAECKSIEKS